MTAPESILNRFITIGVGLTPSFFIVCEMFILLHTEESVLNRFITMSVGLTSSIFFVCEMFLLLQENLHSSFIVNTGGHVVDSTDFDFSMLYRLIRNFLTIPSPTSGWGNEPLPRNLNETDDIERIRNIRNFLAHSSKFEICENDFITYWSDLSQVN